MGSKQQTLLQKKIQSIFTNVKIVSDYRSHYFKNETTNRSYEIDLYIPFFNVGIEYQGAIHFKSLDKYKNNPDKSRLNDTIKNDYSLKAKTVPFALIEMFEEDLISKDFKTTFLQRLQNTQDLHFEHQKYLGCSLLEKMKIFLINNLDIKCYALGKNGIVCNPNSKGTGVCNNIDISKYIFFSNLSAMQLLGIKSRRNSIHWYKPVYNYAKEKNLIDEYCEYIIKGNNDAEVHYNLTLRPIDSIPDIKNNKYGYIKMLEKKLLKEKQRLNIGEENNGGL